MEAWKAEVECFNGGQIDMSRLLVKFQIFSQTEQIEAYIVSSISSSSVHLHQSRVAFRPRHNSYLVTICKMEPLHLQLPRGTIVLCHSEYPTVAEKHKTSKKHPQLSFTWLIMKGLEAESNSNYLKADVRWNMPPSTKLKNRWLNSQRLDLLCSCILLPIWTLDRVAMILLCHCYRLQP